MILYLSIYVYIDLLERSLYLSKPLESNDTVNKENI